MRGTELARTVRFIAWSNEEVGLFGAYHDAQGLGDNPAHVRFVWNLDSAGNPGGRKGISFINCRNFESFIENAAEEMGQDIFIGQGISCYSDHYPYFLRGLPTGSMTTVGVRPAEGLGIQHLTRWIRPMPCPSEKQQHSAHGSFCVS